MLSGRDSELAVLNEYLHRDNNQIMVLYGQNGIGKTALMKEFIQDKENAFYFDALSLSEREQLYKWSNALSKKGYELNEYCTYDDIFQIIMQKEQQTVEKTILIFDEFQNLCKSSTLFMDALFSYLDNTNHNVFVILSSSSIEWVENVMVKKLGIRAKRISGFSKLRELSFQEFAKFFKQFSFEECIEGYAIFGGIPKLWKQLDASSSLQDNLIHRVLNNQSSLYDYGERFVANELRETSVYNTILLSLADGITKLNDLYEHTAFSRAKISVYLKNLMELGIVEKEFSYDTEGRSNTQKGVYGIANHYVAFTYRFLFSLRNEQIEISSEEFYKKRIAPELKAYTEKYFSNICKEYMEIENQNKHLPIVYNRLGKWIGKVGTIDFVAQDENKTTLIGLCNFEKPMMRYEDYEWLLFCAKKARLNTDYVYLFSAGGFDEKLKFAQASKKNITLLTLDNL